MFRAILSVCLLVTVLSAFSQTMSIDNFNAPDSVDSISIVSDFTSIVKDNNRVLLSWRVNDAVASEFFSVERSLNGKDFEIIAVIRLSKSNPKYEYTDESPANGKSVYRIRCGSKQGAQLYSSPVTVQIVGPAAFKFYPNPVDNILIIRSEDPLEVQKLDASGNSKIALSKVQGLQTINVTTLEKGIYLLRVTNKLTNLVSQEKLIKN